MEGTITLKRRQFLKGGIAAAAIFAAPLSLLASKDDKVAEEWKMGESSFEPCYATSTGQDWGSLTSKEMIASLEKSLKAFEKSDQEYLESLKELYTDNSYQFFFNNNMAKWEWELDSFEFHDDYNRYSSPELLEQLSSLVKDKVEKEVLSGDLEKDTLYPYKPSVSYREGNGLWKSAEVSSWTLNYNYIIPSFYNPNNNIAVVGNSSA